MDVQEDTILIGQLKYRNSTKAKLSLFSARFVQ